jgi:short-subunit dehydrogenase
MFAMYALTTVTISQVALEQIIAAPGGRIVNIGAMLAMKAEADYGTWDQP